MNRHMLALVALMAMPHNRAGERGYSIEADAPGPRDVGPRGIEVDREGRRASGRAFLARNQRQRGRR